MTLREEKILFDFYYEGEEKDNHKKQREKILEKFLEKNILWDNSPKPPSIDNSIWSINYDLNALQHYIRIEYTKKQSILIEEELLDTTMTYSFYVEDYETLINMLSALKMYLK